ncbi:hypothetical protein K8I61_09495 [bacterium]|nr:hypothetical protein [bacterium]
MKGAPRPKAVVGATDKGDSTPAPQGGAGAPGDAGPESKAGETPASVGAPPVAPAGGAVLGLGDDDGLDAGTQLNEEAERLLDIYGARRETDITRPTARDAVGFPAPPREGGPPKVWIERGGKWDGVEFAPPPADGPPTQADAPGEPNDDNAADAPPEDDGE